MGLPDDGREMYAADPDALSRIYSTPYLHYEPELAYALEDESGAAG